MKLTSQFGACIRRHMPMQLHTSNSGCLRNITNFFGTGVHKNSDRANLSRHRLDDLPGSPGPNVSRTFGVKIESKHFDAELNTRSGILNIRDAANLDLHWSHGWPGLVKLMYVSDLQRRQIN